MIYTKAAVKSLLAALDRGDNMFAVDAEEGVIYRLVDKVSFTAQLVPSDQVALTMVAYFQDQKILTQEFPPINLGNGELVLTGMKMLAGMTIDV